MSFSPYALLKRCVPDDFKLYARTRLIDGRLRWRTPDRVFLEETVFPWFRDSVRVRTVLDVGCDWYTRAYPDLLKAERYETIDLDPAKVRYARGREEAHCVGSLLELDQDYGVGEFDLVICNGVLGWGVNDAASQIARVLRPGGWLVLGWNDMDGYRPETLSPFDQPPLERFVLPTVGVDTRVTTTGSKHTYRFFLKGDGE